MPSIFKETPTQGARQPGLIPKPKPKAESRKPEAGKPETGKPPSVAAAEMEPGKGKKPKAKAKVESESGDKEIRR